MKKLFLVIFVLFCLMGFLLAQAPDFFKYQAIARTSSGDIMVNEPVEFTISILRDSVNGTSVYSETHNVTTNQFGLVTFNIGEGANPTSAFSNINWSVGTFFVEIKLNGTLIGESQLLSVPFAKYADKAGSGDYKNLSNTPDLTIFQKNDSLNKLHIDELRKRIDVLEDMFLNMGKLVYETETTGRFKDLRDNQIYKFTVIGNQIWMVENLRSTKYNDGTAIPLVTDNNEWPNLTSGAYCWFNNDSSYSVPYGAIYNGYVVETGSICPTGWHVPTDDEWKILEQTIGMDSSEIDEIGSRGENIGGKLKADYGWLSSPFSNNTNNFNFSAVAGGTRINFDGGFYNIKKDCLYWLSSEYSPGILWIRELDYNTSGIERNASSKEYGNSIRCLKNE